MLTDTFVIIYTDLDGTLLDSEDYNYQPALPLIKQLTQQQIPIVPVTSKTRQEVEPLRQKIGLTTPFIVENGSGIFIDAEDQQFINETHQAFGSYRLIQLGCTYQQARTGLKAIASELQTTLTGFGDLTAQEIVNLTGLSLKDAQRAKAREFSEPFITPKDIAAQTLENAVEKRGFRVVVGDRFSHLLGGKADKGEAVNLLTQLSQPPSVSKKVITIGLGNSPNDRRMLDVVDFPIIIPGKKGPHPGLVGIRGEVAPGVGPQGWTEAVTAILARLA